jgi:hypothetical protein
LVYLKQNKAGRNRRCRPRPERLILHRTYTARELAVALAVHPRTVQTWKCQGLSPIDPEEQPALFSGADARKFLARRNAKRKTPLMNNQFYCVKCRRPVVPDPVSVSWEPLSHDGRCPEAKIRAMGRCRHCDSIINRFATVAWIELAFPDATSTESHKRLSGRSHLAVNAMNERGQQYVS